MVNYEIIDKERNIAMLSFSTMQMPIFSVIRSTGRVKYGKKDDFPNQLLRLYEEHEEHNAIITAKANYLYGKGFKTKDETQQLFLDNWMKYANRYESWHEVDEKTKVDLELFDCYYLQVITDLTGKAKEFYHLQYSNIRTNEDRDKIWYSENQLDSKKHESEFYLFNPNSGKPGVFFMRMEYYKPSQNKLASVYSKPKYIACVKSISTDIDISTFNNNYVANGFSAGTMVTFFQEEPKTPEAKRKLKEAILNTHSSPEKAGSIVLAWAGVGGTAPAIEALNVDDLDKKFEFTSKRCLDKIIRGHNVTNPELFGVKTEGQLGTRVSLKDSYELMINTYTKPRQKNVIKWREEQIKLTTGQDIKLDIDQLEPIGLDLSNDIDLTIAERRALKGYDTEEPSTKPQAQAVNDAINALSPLVANKVLESMSEDEIRALASLPPKNAQIGADGKPIIDANGMPVAPVQAAATNSALTGLTAADNSDMRRIVRDYQRGVSGMNEPMAIDRLMGYGLTKEQADKWLGINQPAAPQPVKMSSQTDDFIIAQFAAIDTTSDLELEFLHEEDVHIHNSKDALKFEFDMNLKFADNSKPGFLDNLVSGILGKIGIGNKKESKSDEPTFKTEILTKYHYALRPGAPALSPGGKSREFCVKMLALKNSDGTAREFTFEQIDSVRLAGLSNGMPEVDNIWDFAGGFSTNPNTGERKPWCRHSWHARTYKVKTKI